MIDTIIRNMDTILSLAAMLLGFLLGLPKVVEWRARAESFVEKNKFEKALALAMGIVSEIYDETVRELKERGTFDSSAKRAVKTQALTILKTRLLDQGLSIAQEMLPAIIELAINGLKKTATQAQPASSPSAPSATSPSAISPEIDESELTALASAVPGIPGA